MTSVSCCTSSSTSPPDLVSLPPDLLEHVYHFLSIHTCLITSHHLSKQTWPRIPNIIWQQRCQHLWPVMYRVYENKAKHKHGHAPDAVTRIDWSVIYKWIATGAKHVRVQVYNRERLTPCANEFVMSAYDAEAIYDHKKHAYRVAYLPDGRGLISEYVESWMLRDCVSSCQDPSIPHPSHTVWKPSTPTTFHIGDAVEIQWRKHPSHPFGWWYGIISHIDYRCITVSFAQYHDASPWKYIIVMQGTSTPIQVPTGYTGGIRHAVNCEQWKTFMPTTLIL